MLRQIWSVGSWLTVAVAAFVALALAVGITTAVIDRFGRMSVLEVIERSLIVAVFVVMAFVMISYLIRKFRAWKQTESRRSKVEGKGLA